MILVGDIGGTKTNIALYDFNDNLIFSQKFVSKNYTKFSDIINEFKLNCKELCKFEIVAACFGIAGPVINGDCKTTNLPWDIVSTKELQKELNIQKVALLNDLAITSYGMLYLSADELVSLNKDGIKQTNTSCVIAAGTGLGEGILYFDGKEFHPLSTEGGHSDFAPLDEIQDALLKFLRIKYPNHVSYERILSGEGIYTLYEFLKEYRNLKEPNEMLNIEKGIDKSAVITKCAIENSDELCTKTLELFCYIYGAEASNLALKSFSVGGVFIGGGIAPKILPFLQKQHFMEGFLNKGRFKSFLEKLEIRVSLNQETALLGALNYAKDKLN